VIKLSYKENRQMKVVKIHRGIRDIVIALNLLVKRSPQIELDEFMQAVIGRK